MHNRGGAAGAAAPVAATLKRHGQRRFIAGSRRWNRRRSAGCSDATGAASGAAGRGLGSNWRRTASCVFGGWAEISLDIMLCCIALHYVISFRFLSYPIGSYII